MRYNEEGSANLNTNSSGAENTRIDVAEVNNTPQNPGMFRFPLVITVSFSPTQYQWPLGQPQQSFKFLWGKYHQKLD